MCKGELWEVLTVVVSGQEGTSCLSLYAYACPHVFYNGSMPNNILKVKVIKADGATNACKRAGCLWQCSGSAVGDSGPVTDPPEGSQADTYTSAAAFEFRRKGVGSWEGLIPQGQVWESARGLLAALSELPPLRHPANQAGSAFHKSPSSAAAITLQGGWLTSHLSADSFVTAPPQPLQNPDRGPDASPLPFCFYYCLLRKFEPNDKWKYWFCLFISDLIVKF